MHLGPDQCFARTVWLGPHPKPECHIVKHAHVPKQRVVLKHETYLALAHRLHRGVHTFKQDLPLVGEFQAGNDAQQRGLAAAGRPEQRDQFTWRYGQINTLECLKSAKTLDDVTNGNAHEETCSGCRAVEH